MKTKSILSIILLAVLMISAYGCNKNEDDNPIVEENSYFKAKINGKAVSSKKVEGGSLLEVFGLVPYDNSDNPILQLSLYHYNGIGSYSINKDITIQYNGTVYQGKEGNGGNIEIKIDNQLASEGNISSKGNFYGVFYNLIDETDNLDIKDAEFVIRN